MDAENTERTKKARIFNESTIAFLLRFVTAVLMLFARGTRSINTNHCLCYW